MKSIVPIFYLRLLLVIFILAVTFALGYIRTSFIINIENHDLPFLLERENFVINPSFSLSQATRDPRFFSLIIYTLAFIVLSLSINYLLFLKMKYVKITLLIYGILIGVIVAFFGLSMLSPDFHHANNIANRLKNIIQEPYICFLIIGYCLYDRKYSKS